MIAFIQKFIRRMSSSPTAMTAFVGYVAMASAMIIGVVSVPMALKFLSKEEFGLWRIVGQSLGYLLLLDFGVSSAAGRMLVGPLRTGDKKELHSWWTVFMLVLGSQGLLMLGIGWIFRDIILFRFFDVPPELHRDAEMLWIGMMAANSLQLPFRALSGILYGQNRWYMMHLSSIATSWVNLLLFAALLLAGMRTSAYLVASVGSVASGALIWWIAVRQSGIRLQVRPSLFSRDKLKELFGFSSGVFLMGLAAQITYMSQGIVIAKIVGLSAVAAFVVSCSSATILIQLLRRAFEAFIPRWLQLYVDGKQELVCDQWRGTMNWYVPVAVAGSLGILIFNRSFSELYGGGPHNYEGRFFDLMRAAWVLLQLFLSSINFPFSLSARVKAWSVVGLADAGLQLVLSIAFTRWLGSGGLFLGSAVASLLVLAPFYYLYAPRQLDVAPRRMLAGIVGQYAVGLALIVACYFTLVSRGPVAAGWWPTPLEFVLGIAVTLAFLLLMLRRKQLQFFVKGATA